jgi:hypothetical protein
VLQHNAGGYWQTLRPRLSRRVAPEQHRDAMSDSTPPPRHAQNPFWLSAPAQQRLASPPAGLLPGATQEHTVCDKLSVFVCPEQH